MRSENEFCSFYHKPCIENACPAWRDVVPYTRAEREALLSADIPVIGGKGRYCLKYEKTICRVIKVRSTKM
jgi:hypothetical protein